MLRVGDEVTMMGSGGVNAIVIGFISGVSYAVRVWTSANVDASEDNGYDFFAPVQVTPTGHRDLGLALIKRMAYPLEDELDPLTDEDREE